MGRSQIHYDVAVFSARTRWDLRPNRLAARLAAKRASGARLLDLTESNPTRARLPYPEDLLQALARPEARSTSRSRSAGAARARPWPPISHAAVTPSAPSACS